MATTSTATVKLQLRVKNTGVSITVKNRVHTGHILSLDDGYCTVGFRKKRVLPAKCLLKHLLL